MYVRALGMDPDAVDTHYQSLRDLALKRPARSAAGKDLGFVAKMKAKLLEQR